MDAPASVKTPRVKVKTRNPKELAQDELVMQTNSSSIMSKRSVERIYYPHEPHYFRYFVSKFQRRAPLINRGYHLRLHVIDLSVRRFLERPSDKTKVVINLGCGSDVLPWQCMTRYPDACRNTKFVDIDFPDLMMKKRTIVSNTPELSSVFAPLDTNAGEHVLLKSDMYSQIGCDLRKTTDVEQALSTIINISECTFMFVAEVSITYMETEGADGVIKWASSLSQAEFCLLEQILPDGADHPFAETMLSHFNKLKTPIKSVARYPTTESQDSRFKNLGWSDVEAISLWQAWTDDNWISASQRRALDHVEPFDEWEEFALFASHYCVVIARNSALGTVPTENTVADPTRQPRTVSPEIMFHPYSGIAGKRRFGATLEVRDELGEKVYANTFGLGTKARLKSCDVHAYDSSKSEIRMGSVGPSNRVCHAIVNRPHCGSLLVGGRTSPTIALRDCWLFSTEQSKWLPSDDLPIPLYRHAVAQLGQSNMTILIGGKSDGSTVFPGCLIHRPGFGWIECEMSEKSRSIYQPVFGAMLVSDGSELVPGTFTPRFRGFLAGGLREDGTIARRLLIWWLELPADGKPTIFFMPAMERASEEPQLSLCRFGASALHRQDGSVVVVGGIQHDGIVPRDEEVLAMKNPGASPFKSTINSRCALTLEGAPRPLLVGTSVASADPELLVIMGGGATCFSMGTYWNQGCYTLNLILMLGGSYSIEEQRSPFGFQRSIDIINQPLALKPDFNGYLGPQQPVSISEIPRIRVDTEDDFENIIKAGRPVVIEGSDLGPCVQMWSGAYLTEKVGPQRKVVVHEASSPKMDFNSKNFSYVTKDFDSFMSEVENGGKQYLRALSEEHPSDQPASLKSDFPTLASDFQLPPALEFVSRNEHSSVLRISGQVNMWLHYDVMANVYCQISGSKTLLLFPPSDVSSLSFGPGASSSSLDVLSFLPPSTHPHTAILSPGDILFLPPLWLHATAPITPSGVAVNVFFRSLESNSYAAGRDVYGNRDIAAYEKGRQDVARIANSFSKVPADVRGFYMRRLVDDLAGSING
ncbi:leucine carboxyl methyltransferase [Astrocystis sublimbata]|nr:leucine carboxyl methyltransferase [Astrocystis sublimbata]